MKSGGFSLENFPEAAVWLATRIGHSYGTNRHLFILFEPLLGQRLWVDPLQIIKNGL